jgi:replicative DNA helicase
MAEDIIRKLPFSAIAEQSLLGSILIDPASINMVADMISSEDFYLEEHKQIYLAMHGLFITNSQIDVVTLIDELVKKGVYSKSGGEEYIKVIAQTVPNALNVKDYATIVKQKSILRICLQRASIITICHVKMQANFTRISLRILMRTNIIIY